jgi:hypothetical protein
MVESIRGRIADLKEETRLADIVKIRAATIAKDFDYRSESDTSPNVFSVQTIVAVPGEAGDDRRSSDAPIKVNVLADDYWDLSRYLR